MAFILLICALYVGFLMPVQTTVGTITIFSYGDVAKAWLLMAVACIFLIAALVWAYRETSQYTQ